MNDDSFDNLINQLNNYCDQQLLLSNQNKEKINKKKMYLCKYYPHDIPTFKIIFNNNVYSLKLSCLCKERNETFTFEEAFNKLVFDYGENINYDNYFNCQETDHEGNYFYIIVKFVKEIYGTYVLTNLKNALMYHQIYSFLNKNIENI